MMDDSRAHFDAYLALYHAITDADPVALYGWTPSDKIGFLIGLIKKLTTDHEFREDFVAFDGRGAIAYESRDSEDPRINRRPDLNRLDEMRISRRGLRCHWSSRASAG